MVYSLSFIALTLHVGYLYQLYSSLTFGLPWPVLKNSKLTDVLGNVPQKINLHDFLGFDKDTSRALKTSSSLLLALVPVFLTPTTPCTIIITLEPYIPSELKTTDQTLYFDLSLFYNLDCSLFLSPSPTLIHYH